MTLTATNVDVLRRGWADAVASLAPEVDELPVLLRARLEQAVNEDLLDEQSLLAVVDEAARVAMRSMEDTAARALGRRMQRAVYEYLLSLDAATPVETEPARVVVHSGGTPLIGAEEIAELAGYQTIAAPPEVELQPAAEPAPEPAAEVQTLPEPAPEPAAEPEPEATAAAELVPDFADVIASLDVAEAEEMAPGAEPDPEDAEEPAQDAASARRGRFMMFRRNGTVAPMPGDAAMEPGAVAAENGNAVAAENGNAAAAENGSAFVAPRDGFHLTDHADFEVAAPEPPPEIAAGAPEVEPAAAADPPPPPEMEAFAAIEPEPPAAAVPAPAAEPPAAAEAPTRDRSRGPSARGWRVRSLRARREAEAAAAAAPPADGTAPEAAAAAEAGDEDDEESPAETLFHSDPRAIETRRAIDDRLRRRRCDEAASLMQRLAAEIGGRPVADLGLDAGDRCRALGKTNAALSCYLAASRADPVYDEPLLRLADICLDDRDVDLAVSYLERVARLHRLRGDHKGAIRVYRKIATIAPNREDILSVLMRAQATGRFDD